jgi:uncharacterized protein (TIRG00374 family)
VKAKFVKVFRFLFFLLASIALLYFAFRSIDPEQLMIRIRQSDYRWVALSLVFAFLALMVRSFRWRLLIETIDARPSLLHVLHAINIGYMANFVFPRIGEITRCAALNRTDRLPVDSVFGTVIVERIFDILMTGLILLLILLLKFDMVGDFMAHHILEPVTGRIPDTAVILRITAALVAGIVAVVPIVWIFRSRLAKIAALRKIKGWIIGVSNGVRSIYKVKNTGLFLITNVLVFGMYFLQTYIMFMAFEMTSSLGIADALFILVISSLSFIIPVQGGIGAYHWIVAMGLTVFGLSYEDGMVYALMSHTSTSLLLIVLGGISVMTVFYKNKFQKNKIK